MDLTSSSWSVWLHLFSFHFHFAANLLTCSELTDFLMLEKKAGRQCQQIANESVESVCIYYIVFLYFLY